MNNLIIRNNSNHIIGEFKKTNTECIANKLNNKTYNKIAKSMNNIFFKMDGILDILKGMV